MKIKVFIEDYVYDNETQHQAKARFDDDLSTISFWDWNSSGPRPASKRVRGKEAYEEFPGELFLFDLDRIPEIAKKYEIVIKSHGSAHGQIYTKRNGEREIRIKRDDSETLFHEFCHFCLINNQFENGKKREHEEDAVEIAGRVMESRKDLGFLKTIKQAYLEKMKEKLGVPPKYALCSYTKHYFYPDLLRFYRFDVDIRGISL